MQSGRLLSFVGLSVALASAEVAVCPGEGARYGDHKCDHDPTHRVCAQLLDQEGQPLSWGRGDFWQITGQKAFQWDADIRANHGDSWCICMWATASLIQAVGCENVHLHCEATDVAYVMSQYSDGGTDLAPAKACLQQKCGAGVLQKSLSMPEIEATTPAGTSGFAQVALVVVLGLTACVVVAKARATKRPHENAAVQETLVE